MYLGGFYEFPKFRQNRHKNARFLVKNGHFCRNSGMQVEKKNWRKVYAFLGKWSNWAKNWIFGVFAILRVPRAIFVKIAQN